MKKPLCVLKGLRVTQAEKIHDYVQLAFEGEMGLSIYNDWQLVPNTLRLSELVGMIVVAIEENDLSIALELVDGVKLIVDMSEEAYHGPEAVQFNRPGEPVMIWN